MTSSIPSRFPRGAAVLLLVVLPLGLRLWPIGHGLPENYVADTHVVRNALGMARDKDPVPPVGKYSTYPYLLPYMLLPVYAGEFVVGRVAGTWGGVGEFGDTLLLEPERAHLPARWLVALLAALAPWIAYRAGRAMGLRAGAWVAAYLVATSLLHVQFSVQERPWAPVVTFMLLSAWPAALYTRDGDRRHLLLSGLAAAGAFACHQAGGFALGLAGFAWAVGPGGSVRPRRARRFADGALCVGLFAVVALLAGYPHYLRYGIAADVGVNALTFGGQSIVFEFRAATFVKLTRALLGYDPLLLLLGCAGLIAALRTRGSRPAALFVLSWAVFFLTNQGDHVRYVLPVAALLCWPAGWAAERALARPVTRVLLFAALGLPLVQAVRLGQVLRRDDTRTLAAERLAAEFAGERIAVDAHGPDLPLDLASLERLAGWRELGARERHRAELLRAGFAPEGIAGFDAVPLEAIFDYDFRSWASEVESEEREELGEDPNEALRRLNCRLLLVVDKTPGDGRPAILVDPAVGPNKMAGVRTVGEPLFVVSPARTDARADGNLPGELTFPLTDLWRVARPGPELALFRLPE